LRIIKKLQYKLHNNKDVKIFTYENNDEEIKNFVNENIYKGITENKFEITEHNFDRVYLKWLEKVKPSIDIIWEEEKKIGILEGDFFLADLLSRDDLSIKESLLIVLQNDHYKLTKSIKNSKIFVDDKYYFKDKQKAYKEFWGIYKRPPLPIYWENIIGRKDLLVPQDIRERKGSFFTPQIWVELSQKYIADVFGVDWQDEYYVWDCCAGTGNLLVGINRKIENVFASTIDQSDVKAMHDRIDNGARLLKRNVFQFDFLNDDFKKLPNVLKDIIYDEEKRKKLVIYINPPYAEVSSKGVKGKAGVNQSKLHKEYTVYLGTAGRELFTQFLTRIYFEIEGCKISEFSTLKALSGSAFENFRNYFMAKLLKCFIVPANTFDNVNGSFPIGFKIWDTKKRKTFKEIEADVYNKEGDYIGKKRIYSYNKNQYINKWISQYKTLDNPIGFMAGINGNKFQHNSIVYICNTKEQLPNPRGIWITDKNFIEVSIYYAVRHCITSTWLNDHDQFLCPNDGYKDDTEFQTDCLVYTLFNTNIQSKYGINHWIPFTEKEVNAKNNFKSHFMSDFIDGKIKVEKKKELFENKSIRIKGKLKFSKEAQAVYDSGRKLWKYYHSYNKVNVDASLYDIKMYFQGAKDGRMNNKSNDEEYNRLIGTLRDNLKILAKKIEPKVYEYGFLK
jgi:16S rRNA G966 N2-methylase RsmD